MPPAQPQRRQNTSCDPCRRSKRRCFFSPGDGEAAGAACANCKRLGHHCTFDFARSRSKIERRRRQDVIISRQSVEWEESSAPERAVDGLTGVPGGEFDALMPLLDLEFDHYVEDDATCFPGNTDLFNPLTPATATEEAQSKTRSYLPSARSDVVQCVSPYNAQYLIGNSLNSPIRLLNSKLDATILDERLARIHDTIVTGCASRFVDYDCNLYATESRYRLEDGIIENSQEPIPVRSSSSLQTNFPLLNPGQSETEEGRMTPQMLANNAGHAMTVLGTVRFLDHFSDLYGNRLTLTARMKSDEALKAVLRAFSLQWLSPYNEGQEASDSLTSPFHDVWFQARSLINNALSAQSFRVVYAILLFDGISIPTEAGSGPAGPVKAHEFLDAGLQMLSYLDGLVKEYCANLGPRSKYGALLEASLSVARWGGYIRDIGAALTSDHRCKLPGASNHVKAVPSSYGSVLSPPDYQALNEKVPSICRQAVAEAFSVWKQVIEVKGSILEPAQGGIDLPSRLSEVITSTLEAVDRFNQSFRSFMNRCIESLEHLSIHSRTSSVSIVLYWNLGVLILAESLSSTMRGNSHICDPQIISNMRTYQEEAVSSIARTAKCVLSLPTEEIFNLQNGLSAEVPIIAYHITPSLTAMTFQKAIETIVNSQSSPLFSLDLQEGNDEIPNLAADGVWRRQVDIIMKGLSSLQVTVGGSQAASAALQSLMREHGDILSECWSSDFST